MTATDTSADAHRGPGRAAMPQTKTRRRRASGTAALYYAPVIGLLGLLVAWPLLNVFWQSFHYVSLVDRLTSGFAAFENYAYVLQDEEFFPALWNTVVWTGFRSPGNTRSASSRRWRSCSRCAGARSFAASSSSPG